MDREFVSVDVIRFLDEHGEKFLMTISKTPGIKKVVLEFRSDKRKTVSKYEMRSNDGIAFRFWLMIKSISRKQRVKKDKNV